jgi:hypothetical protein
MGSVQIPIRRRSGAIVAYTLVDDTDAPLLMQWRWCLDNDGYAMRSEYTNDKPRGQISIRMNRFLMGCVVGDRKVVDHANRDRLDNRRPNLRFATSSENASNRRRIPHRDFEAWETAPVVDYPAKPTAQYLADGSVRIPVTDRGGATAWARVDGEDSARVLLYRWGTNGGGYAVTHTRLGNTRTTMGMHRLILNAGRGNEPFQVDHINGDRLDNRRKNLREGTRAQNRQNLRSYRGSSSRYRGVSWHKGRRRWVANCRVDGKLHHLGYFENEHAAAMIASEYRRQHMPWSVEPVVVRFD